MSQNVYIWDGIRSTFEIYTATTCMTIVVSCIIGCYCVFAAVRVSSVEKDGSPLSDEKQTVQISLFSLLKDFLLQSTSPEELHSVLAYVWITSDDEQIQR